MSEKVEESTKNVATVTHVGLAIREPEHVIGLALVTDKWGPLALRMASREVLMQLREKVEQMIHATEHGPGSIKVPAPPPDRPRSQ